MKELMTDAVWSQTKAWTWTRLISCQRTCVTGIEPWRIHMYAAIEPNRTGAELEPPFSRNKTELSHYKSLTVLLGIS